MSSISFDNVYMLFIAIPLAALLTVPFCFAVRKDNRNGHNIASLVIHAVLAVCIAFAAAGTEVVTVVTETDVYVVADVSYSANRNLDTVDGYIKSLSRNLPRNSKMGVVTFGKDYELFARLGGKIGKVSESSVDGSETNIIPALEYTAGLFAGDVIKRIVLVTDGKQTYDEDADALKRTVASLTAQGIHVDAMYLDDNIGGDAREVQISSADLRRNVYVGRKEEASFVVDSSIAQRATVTLYRGDEAIDSRTRELSVGANTVSFTLDTSAKGTFDYRAEVVGEADECAYNNVYSFSQNVTDVFDVLVVTEKWSDAVKAVELYGEHANLDIYEWDRTVRDRDKTAYAANHPEVTFHMSNLNAPSSLENLCKYDEIVLSSVDISKHKDYSLFITNLDKAVSAFGKSLVTIGDMNIQTKMEGELNELDSMLPVRYGDAEGKPKLYTIVIDMSHSMRINSGMLLARVAAKQLVNFLSDDDYLCVVGFYGDVRTIRTPVSLADNREDLLRLFDREIEFGQGTYISLGLDRAAEELRNLPFSQKEVMLISDGVTFEGSSPVEVGGQTVDEKAACVDAVARMRAYGIYTSVLAVGTKYSEREWLQDLAEKTGGGHYYFANSDSALNNVLFGQISQDVRKPIVTDDTWVINKRPHDEVLGDINVGTEQIYVSRYVLAKSKPSATNVFTAMYSPSNGVEIEVPLYSYWGYGNGRVASYAGEMGELRKYGGEIDQSVNNAFFSNIIDVCTPGEKNECPFTVNRSIEGKVVRVELLPGLLRSSAEATVNITTPLGEQLQAPMVYDSTLYYYEFVAPSVGKYSVTLGYSYGGNDYTSDAGFTLSYEPEYDAFQVFVPSVLYKILESGGSVSEDGNLSIRNDDSEQELYVFDLTAPLAIIAVILFVADVIIRKLKWNDIVSLFRKVGSGKGGAK